MPSDLPEIIEQRVDKAYASGGYGMTETLAVGSQAAGQVFDAKPHQRALSRRLWQSAAPMPR